MMRRDMDFYRGTIAALAIVALYDKETLFWEIVKSAGEAELIAVARRTGNMRWSGLSQYGYGREKASQP